MTALSYRLLICSGFLLSLLFSSCYSFKGTSIPVEVNTFYVATYDVAATDNVPPGIEVTFTEKLKDKIRLESRLKYNDTEPDIEFSGTIVSYVVTSEAPQAGETTAFNKLRIAVSIDYINNEIEEDKWKRTFSFETDFPSDQNLIDIQDDLIEIINNQIAEDIFNAAFNNW